MIIATIALASIVLLAALLTFAGVSKLLALDEFAAAIVSFGPPTWSGKPLGLLICLAEIWASALLLFMPSAFAGATSAAVLFAVFATSIACNLAIGRTPSCRCFGQTSTEPISWRSFARVLGLLALAVALAWKAYVEPTFGVQSLLASLDRDFIVALSVIIILGGAISVLSWSVLQLFRQNGKLLIRVEALENSQGAAFPGRMLQPDIKPEPISLLAPQFELTNQRGKLVRLEDLMLERRPVMLVFVSSGCGPCHQLLPDVARWQIDRAAEMRVVLITERPPAAEVGAFNQLNDVLFDDQKAAFEKYHITGTPSAVVILPTGHVGSTLMMGPDSIRQYMTATDGAAQRLYPIVDPTSFVERPGGGIQSIGTPLPALSLQTEAGESISTTAFRGGADTVFLFWNPSCHFCEQMIPDLSNWQRERTNATPMLVIVSPTPPGLGAIPATVCWTSSFVSAALAASPEPRRLWRPIRTAPSWNRLR